MADTQMTIETVSFDCCPDNLDKVTAAFQLLVVQFLPKNLKVNLHNLVTNGVDTAGSFHPNHKTLDAAALVSFLWLGAVAQPVS